MENLLISKPNKIDKGWYQMLNNQYQGNRLIKRRINVKHIIVNYVDISLGRRKSDHSD